MGSNRLSFSASLQHEQLRQDGDRFQIDRKSPQNFNKGEIGIDEQGQQKRGDEEKLDSEGVLLLVESRLEFDVHGVAGDVQGADEEKLKTLDYGLHSNLNEFVQEKRDFFLQKKRFVNVA
jgi:hypothetical protein